MIHICSTLEAKPTPFGKIWKYSFHLWRQQLRPNFSSQRPKRPEPRAREMAEFSLRYLRCHDYVSSDPDKKTLAGSQFNFKTKRVLYCCFFKSNKKEEINGDELVFVPAKKATHQDGSGVPFRWEDIHIFKPDRCTKSVWFQVFYHGGKSFYLSELLSEY